MNTYIKLLLLLPLSATSCVNLSPEESVLIERAELIDVFPIKRNKLIKELELEGETGRRFGGGGMRSGSMILSEYWTHSSGLVVTAYDTEYVGPVAISGTSLDDFLDGTAVFPGTNVKVNSPRESFNGFTISKGETTLYNSRE